MLKEYMVDYSGGGCQWSCKDVMKRCWYRVAGERVVVDRHESVLRWTLSVDIVV